MPPPFLLLIVLALVSTNVAAQPPEVRWTSYHNDGDSNWRDICNRVIQTPDSGFLIGGESRAERFACYFVVKTDSIGIEEWQKKYDIGRLSGLGGVVKATDGCYFLTGGSVTHSGTYGNIHYCPDF